MRFGRRNGVPRDRATSPDSAPRQGHTHCRVSAGLCPLPVRWFGHARFDAKPFRIFFAGRIETNKGIYDFVEIADRLQASRPGSFHFDICGEGSQLQPRGSWSQSEVSVASLPCHGFCNRDQMTAVLNAASAVILPTTTAFEEGFKMVCAEAILAGRPLVTSAVCPALQYVKEAAIEVTPNSVTEYCQALLNLSRSRSLFESKRMACRISGQQFYDQQNSWGS
jgi:glycogen synthase